MFLPVDWCRKALPCLFKPSGASRLNKLARKPPAAHPGPPPPPRRARRCPAGAPPQPEALVRWCRAEPQPRWRWGDAGEGGPGERDPPPSPLLPSAGLVEGELAGAMIKKKRKRKKPQQPQNGKCYVGSVVGGWSLLTFRCIRRWGKVAFCFRLLFLPPPPPPSMFYCFF